MQSLGKVLERLHTAWDHLSSAQGTMRLWYEPLRTRHAWEAWRDAPPPGSIAMIQPAEPQESLSPQETTAEDAREQFAEQYYRFWMAKPWRWRIEQFDAGASSSSMEHQQVLVIDGGKWWSWSAGNHVSTNVRTGHITQPKHAGVDPALLVMLDPAPLTGTLRIQVAKSAEELGRRGDIVIAAARDEQQNPGLWPGADHYRLLVERERGILLRAEALLADHVFAGTAFTDLILDQEPPEDRFVFQPPAGVPIHDL